VAAAEDAGMSKSDHDRVELLPGTLDLIVLRALATLGPLHAYALASRLEQLADHPLLLNQGTRLEQKGWIRGDWRKTENNREAKFYAITRPGRRAVEHEVERWRRSSGLVNKLLVHES
jgi:DNA-binding PadR family transcriptional regulator